MARPVVRAAMGTTLVKRVNIVKFSIPDVTSVDFDNPSGFDLLIGSEAQDEEIESTGGTTGGTDVAQVPLYSKLKAVKLNMIIQGQGAELVRWQLLKSPDSDITNATANTNWHTADDSTTAREVRANQMAKGLAVVNSDRLDTRVKVFVRRKTLARLGTFREGDRLKMVFAKDSTATSCTATLWGNLYVKANA